MGKLTDALKAQPEVFRGPRCSIHGLLGSLPPEEKKALEEALADSRPNRVTATALSIAISSAYGVDIHRASIDRHRRGECLCARRGK